MVKKTTKKKSQSTTKTTRNVKPARTHSAKTAASPSAAGAQTPSATMSLLKNKLPFTWSVRTWNISALATLGPIGYFPKAPGTVGSLVALPLVYLLSYLSAPLMWVSVFLLFILGLVAIEQFTHNKQDKDPSCVIIDEVVGQMIPFTVILPTFIHWPVLFLGFALFRFFDIYKFGAVAYWDQRKNPMGVMMDDVTAGLCTGFIMAMLQVVVVDMFGI